MGQSADAAHDGRTGGRESPIRAKVAIEPHPDSNCAVLNAEGEIEDVTHRLKTDPSACPGVSALRLGSLDDSDRPVGQPEDAVAHDA
jgi:hypothetical protein